jgi:hypothetical protein
MGIIALFISWLQLAKGSLLIVNGLSLDVSSGVLIDRLP